MVRSLSLSILSVLAFLAPTNFSFGQAVTLPAQVRGEVGGWIHVKPLKVDGGIPKWRLDPELEEISPEVFLPPEAAKLFIGKLIRGPAGKFKIESWNAKGDVASDIATCWVVIGKGTTPLPIPDPVPIPIPIAKVKSLTFVVIGPTLKTAAVTEDESLRAWLKENGVGIYGITTKAQQDANPKFKGIPNYSIALQDTSNNLIAHSLITDVAAAKAFVTQHLGK